MRLRCVVLTTAIALTVAPAAAPAADPPVLGPADGVQATLTAGRVLEVRFTGAAAASPTFAPGRRLDVGCGAHPSPPGLQLNGTDDSTARGTGNVSQQGVLRVELDKVLPIDACDVEGVPGVKEGGVVTTVARAALDPAGETWNDEVAHAAPLTALLNRARGTTAYRPASALTGPSVIAVDGPSASAPAGQIGYWTDGHEHAVVSSLSAAGRRLVIEDLGGGMLRTNVMVQGGVPDAIMLNGFGDTASTGVLDDDDPGQSPFHGDAVTSAEGVRAHVSGRRLAISFTGRSAAAVHRVAGRRVLVTCLQRPAPALFGAAVRRPASASSAVVVRVARHGATLRATLRRTGDACLVVDDGKQVAIAVTSDAGRRWWDDLRTFSLLDRLPKSLAAPGGTSYLAPAAIVAKHAGLVAMAGPGATVRPGRVGVWTDGAQRAAVAITSPSGRRITLADEGEGTVRTNLYAELAGILSLTFG
jgi:hypothetical protein